jgi:hypothetical protein
MAVLAALDAMRTSSTSPPPKRFQRVGMKVYKRAPERMIEKVEADITWVQVLDRLSTPCPKKRSNGTYNKFISEKEVSASKKKKSEKERIVRSKKNFKQHEQSESLNNSNVTAAPHPLLQSTPPSLPPLPPPPSLSSSSLLLSLTVTLS